MNDTLDRIEKELDDIYNLCKEMNDKSAQDYINKVNARNARKLEESKERAERSRVDNDYLIDNGMYEAPSFSLSKSFGGE